LADAVAPNPDVTLGGLWSAGVLFLYIYFGLPGERRTI
jgi:hypothetical protein